MPSNCQSYDLILRINNTSMNRHISAVSKRKQRNSLPPNTIFTLNYCSFLLKHIQVVQKLLLIGQCWLATVLMCVRPGLNTCFLPKSLPTYLLECDSILMHVDTAVLCHLYCVLYHVFHVWLCWLNKNRFSL
jgi:hypothetical protein